MTSSNRSRGWRGAWRVGAVCLAWLVSLVLASGAAAEPPAEQPPPESESNRLQLAGEVGLESLDEDFFLGLTAKAGLSLPVPKIGCGDDESGACLTRFRVGVQAPLRLRIIDRGEQQDGLLREEDWDEFGDYLKIVRFVEYGEPEEPLYGRVGELGPVTIGHGTVVNSYYNVVTPDHFRLGVRSSLNTKYGGGALLLNDVARPGLLGGRAYVRPWSFVDPEGWLTRLAVGTTVMGDVSAPFRLARDAGRQPIVGADRFPEVERRQGTWVGGLDVELAVVDSKVLTLTPYTDFNVHFGLGSGLHSGLLAELRPIEKLGFSTRLEYRLMGADYLPDYFGPLYEIDRYQFLGWGVLLPQPKLRVAADRGGDGVMGGYGELTARILGLATVSGAYANHEGPDNASLRLSLQLNPIDRIQLGLFYFKQNFDSFDQVLERDGALMVGETRLGIVGPLFVKAAYSRYWTLRDDGNYESIDRWNVGVGASVAF